MVELRRPKRSSKRIARKGRLERYPEKPTNFANLLVRIGPARAPGRGLFEHAKRCVNKEDTDNCGNAVVEEQKRNSLFSRDHSSRQHHYRRFRSEASPPNLGAEGRKGRFGML
jgi:hypothetical protein